jgi:branched-chain amino acid transport system permease protein
VTPAALVVAVVIIFASPRGAQSVITLVLIYAAIGLGWNVLGGLAGQSSFGHALFVGIGAYTVALLQKFFGLTPLVGMWVGIVIAVLVAVLIGLPTFRLSGVYFSLATLAFPLIMLPLFSWLGFQEVSIPYRPDDGELYLQFSDPRWLNICALALVLIAGGITVLIMRSRFGAALAAIREEPVAAAAAGINVRLRKLQAYAVSAAITAAAGALYASVLLVVTPDAVFGLLVSVQALIIPLVGGRGTLWGPILGSILLVTLSEQLNAWFGATIPGVNGLMFGVALVLVVALARDGLIWRIRDMIAKRRRTPPPSAPEDSGIVATGFAANADLPARNAVLLEVSGARKAFRGNRVLSDVSFNVHAGEIVGVIGPNGAGKTTLLNIINGLVPADAGAVRLLGEDLIGRPPHTVASRGAGRTFQVARLLSRSTVLENVAISTLRFADSASRARTALERVGLGSQSDRLASDLDIGQVRRLELARAMAGAPSLLLVDEILAGLSTDQTTAILRLLREIAATGVGVVIIEHTIGPLAELSDRLVMLDAGTVVIDGVPREVLADSRVIEAYLGRKWAKRA